MRYQSNLKAPDLTRHFRLLNPAKRIAGHDAPSDPDFESGCTFWTHDEAAILFNIAARTTGGGRWVDVGSRFGWTASHLAAAGQYVTLVDPHFSIAVRQHRMEINLGHCWSHVEEVWHEPWLKVAADMAMDSPANYDGFVIDGCHDAPEPLNDVQAAVPLAYRNCIIMLHDFFGKPTRDAARWLMDNGWHGRVYWTPNGVGCFWRGTFTPPNHVRDPAIDWAPHERAISEDFDLRRCE